MSPDEAWGLLYSCSWLFIIGTIGAVITAGVDHLIEQRRHRRRSRLRSRL